MNTINHKIKKTALAQVIAVVAAIFIAYISFMGLVYLSHGQIVASAVAATAIGIALVLLCFMAQQMKGAESRFASSIVKERIAAQPDRARFLADVLDDGEIWELLRAGRDDEAFDLAMTKGGLQ